MDAGKLFTLGGLATGGVSAVSGTATSLAGSGVFGGSGSISIHSSTQIKDIPTSSKSLFQKTHLDCVKDLFPNLSNLESNMRGELGNTETTESNFQLSTVSASTGPVNGCLIVDANYYEKDSKGALAATIELAATKGDYGIILLNSIGNIFEDSKYHFEYRAFFLKKTSNNWNIEAGYQWKDGFFVQDGGGISDVVWSGLDGLNLKAKWGDDQLCKSLSSCQAQTSIKQSYLKSFRWVSPSSPSNTNIWQSLKIEGTVRNSKIYTQDLWEAKEAPELSSLNAHPSVVSVALFKGDKWQKYKTSGLTLDTTSIKNWFNIFKDDKGAWKEGRS